MERSKPYVSAYLPEQASVDQLIFPRYLGPAAVRALKSDGTILIDDWTQYLGPLQQGRLTYSGQWDWDTNSVILKAPVLDAVRSAGKDTTFTIDFYPREPSNSANFTLTV